jgi:hypothetical protein
VRRLSGVGTQHQFRGREYNRHVKVLLLVPAALLLASCARKDIQNPEAVRQAVMEDLQARQAKTGVDLSSMKVEVPSVTFNRDEARASVSFLPKGGQGGMQIPYTLTRKGDKWVVTERGAQHANALPAGASDQPLPPGHPSFGAIPGQSPGPTTDGQTQLPAGHPPVNPKQ